MCFTSPGLVKVHIHQDFGCFLFGSFFPFINHPLRDFHSLTHFLSSTHAPHSCSSRGDQFLLACMDEEILHSWFIGC